MKWLRNISYPWFWEFSILPRCWNRSFNYWEGEKIRRRSENCLQKNAHESKILCQVGQSAGIGHLDICKINLAANVYFLVSRRSESATLEAALSHLDTLSITGQETKCWSGSNPCGFHRPVNAFDHVNVHFFSPKIYYYFTMILGKSVQKRKPKS